MFLEAEDAKKLKEVVFFLETNDTRKVKEVAFFLRVTIQEYKKGVTFFLVSNDTRKLNGGVASFLRLIAIQEN